MLNIEVTITHVAISLARFFGNISQKFSDVAAKHQLKARAEFEKEYGFDPIA